MQQHQRRDIQDWLNLFEQTKQSGLTAVEFCRQQQMHVSEQQLQWLLSGYDVTGHQPLHYNTSGL
ncbi:hypothetical protein [Alteromonas sp. BL110]|uniref:hypothetical protein n=1 Tax=Alteromonas sp. BL110 TaxID=1714845 RepID=UPI001E33ED75|nr:hypothetical protein [Alteromonas sp. BL110]